MPPTDDLLTALAHVRWIGGGSGAGKSTIAKALAAMHGATLYDTDDAMRDHAARCSPDGCPRLTAFMKMNMDDRWVHRTPQVMLDEFHWFAGEGFEFIIADLLALPRDRPVIADGFRLLPHCVAPLLRNRQRAVWLLPTPDFRRKAFKARGSIWDIPNRTSNPKQALANLLERDALFTIRLKQEVAALELNSVEVDGVSSENALVRIVGDRLFG